MSEWAQRITESSQEGSRKIRAREGHRPTEAVMWGLKTRTDKPRQGQEMDSLLGPPKGTSPANTSFNDFGLLTSRIVGQRAEHARCSDGTSRPRLTSWGHDPGWWLLAKVDIRKRG